MKRWLLLPALAVLLAGCAGSGTAVTQPANPPISQSPANTPMPTERPQADLPDLGAAPEIENTVWINADEPVTIASQRGKVILLEFWTFG
ncbi:MAG TPA: hypothetical protein EYP41_18045 [Anaerolineae bacterium]|nr:hypothetical protein [Anaerolineae bacterium]HIP70080.1 hypothetical protein [Anaerolineae bacterium]